jgi:hypothetical protein
LLIFLVLAAILLPHFHRQTGLTSLIRFGETRRDRLAPELAGVPVYLTLGGGYDGQFYAHMALHPPWIYHDLASHYDAPSYRIRRVLLPALAWIGGFGRPAWIVQVYACLNLAAWLAMAWLLTLWLPLGSWMDFGRWCGCLLAAGVLESLRASLTDLPAMLLLLAAMRWLETRQPGKACVLFAASILTRETMALSVFGMLWPREVNWRSLFRAAWVGGLILLPAAAWIVYESHYFPDGRGSPDNFSWPGVALAGSAADALRHLDGGARYEFRLVTLAAMAVQIGVILTGWRRGPAWLRMAWPFLALFPLLGSEVWDGPWAVWRAELPVTVAFCFLIPPTRWFWPLLLLGSLPSLDAFFRLIF